MIVFVVALSLGVGFAVLGLWTTLLVRRQIPELRAGVPSIRFHIVAEVGMAVLLLGGAVGIILDAAWGTLLAATALGAALYSTVNSPGYYADQRAWAAVAMFLGLALLIGVAVVLLVLGA